MALTGNDFDRCVIVKLGIKIKVEILKKYLEIL